MKTRHMLTIIAPLAIGATLLAGCSDDKKTDETPTRATTATVQTLAPTKAPTSSAGKPSLRPCPPPQGQPLPPGVEPPAEGFAGPGEDCIKPPKPEGAPERP